MDAGLGDKVIIVQDEHRLCVGVSDLVDHCGENRFDLWRLWRSEGGEAGLADTGPNGLQRRDQVCPEQQGIVVIVGQ